MQKSRLGLTRSLLLVWYYILQKGSPKIYLTPPRVWLMKDPPCVIFQSPRLSAAMNARVKQARRRNRCLQASLFLLSRLFSLSSFLLPPGSPAESNNNVRPVLSCCYPSRLLLAWIILLQLDILSGPELSGLGKASIVSCFAQTDSSRSPLPSIYPAGNDHKWHHCVFVGLLVGCGPSLLPCCV